jgi:hypothetical protein
MANKPKSAVMTPALVPAGRSTAAPAPVEEPIGDELDTLLDELGGGAEKFAVSIFRRQVTGVESGKLAYVGRVPLLGFTLEDLQRDYGGGRYVLKIYDTSTGKYQKSRQVVIEGAPAMVAPLSHTVEDAALRDELRLIRERVERQPVPQSIDTFAMFQQFATLMTTLVPPAPAPVGGGSAKELLDMYFRGREDGARDVPPGDGGIKSTLMELGAPLLTLARENLELQKTRMGQPASAEDSGQPQGVLDVSPDWVQLIRPFVGGLFERAQLGKNARVYAAALMEDLPEYALNIVDKAIAQRDFVDQFVAAYPQFGQTADLRKWVADFVDEAHILLSDEDADGEAVASGQ